MSKAKLLTLATGLGASYAGWNEYKQWTGPQPSPAVQKWMKKTLKSQGVTDEQLRKLEISPLDELHATLGTPFAASFKGQIQTSISHEQLRKAQRNNILQSIDQYRQKIAQGKWYDSLYETRRLAVENTLALWSCILAHEWAHLEHKDYKKSFYYVLQKEIKSLPKEIAQSIPNSLELVFSIATNDQQLIDVASKISPAMEKLVNEIQVATNFITQTKKILENHRENKSTEIEPIEIQFPQYFKMSKERERYADEKSMEIYKSDPQKLWAAAIFFASMHFELAKEFNLDEINIFDEQATNKIPTIIEDIADFAHPTYRERAFYFADAARRAEELVQKNRK